MRKLLLIVLSIVAAGSYSCGGSGGNTIIPVNPAFTGACTPLPPPSSPLFKVDRLNEFAMKLCYQKQQWEHDAARRTSEGLHAPFIIIWYSPSLFNWMTVQKRQGPVPDGAIAIKEEYMDTDPTSPILFWSVMIKDSSLWWDGWYWGSLGPKSQAARPRLPRRMDAPIRCFRLMAPLVLTA